MPTTAAEVRRAIAEAVSPSHFFVGPGTRLEWDHKEAEAVSWEVFRGRLLDPAHTRQTRTFESWNIYLLGEAGRSAEPLLSVKWDAAAGQVHVVRAVLSYVHEGYDAGGNVILTREVQKWVRELVGTIDVASADELLDDVSGRLFQAVVGTSRLPLTSVEAPLPAFTFGQLGYFFRRGRAAAEPMRSRRELVECGLDEGLSFRQKTKWLETLLRREPRKGVHAALNLFAARAAPAGDEAAPRLLYPLLRALFNEVSLSPHTELTDNALLLASLLPYRFRTWRRDELADFLGLLLRQLGRHLTAFDLVNFHHAGANYPDALLLDAVLRNYLGLFEWSKLIANTELFLDAPFDTAAARTAKRLRRRALRQAWLIRKSYHGLPVPDAPTSPGENARVLPHPYVRVAAEQILNPTSRTKRLFLDDIPEGGFGERPRRVLRESVRDLAHPDELRELGMALYLDRPLGAFKAPGEPDQTPLLSYTAFSRSLALQRLLLLGEDSAVLPAEELRSLRESLEALQVPGVPLAQVRSVPRPGVVSLADAARAAGDFVFLRTTASSLRDFFARFDFAPLAARLGMPDLTSVPWLILGGPEPSNGEIVLTFYEPGGLRKRMDLSADPRAGYVCRAGTDLPRNGLRVRRFWEDQGGQNVPFAWLRTMRERVRRFWEDQGGQLREHDLTGEELFVRPR
jgi:hypothetical protein